MKTVLKLIVCWIAFLVAMFATGVTTSVLHLPTGLPPDSTPMAVQVASGLIAGALLVLGLYPLASGLAAPAAVRAAVLGGFFFVALGVNGVLETMFFTTYRAGFASTEIFYVLEAILLGASLGYFFGEEGAPSGLPHRSVSAWAGRVAAAWVAWPVIYFLFGMCIAPIVIPIYKTMAEIRIPPVQVIFSLQLLRSVIFLGASMPFIALWKGSRRNLWLVLGLTHAVVVGIYGLVAATFWPWVPRITHSIEMTCDSLAYAGVLVLLFARPGVSRTVPAVEPEQPRPHLQMS